jgi:hypothetical protein
VDNVLAKLARSGELMMGCSIPFFTIPPVSQDSTIRQDVSHCRMSQMVMESAFYADRNVSGLWQVLRTLSQTSEESVTSALLSEANRVLLSRKMQLSAHRA